jgi:enoyl-CoA hydratase
LSNLARVTVDSHIATVTLDRPPVNALNLEFYRRIAEAFDEVDDRLDEVRVVILTGAGRYFSAGRDLKAVANEPARKRHAAMKAASEAPYYCQVPVIGAINGPAMGAGFAIALNCDILLASETAIFGWPEIDLATSGGMAISGRALNPYQSRKLLYTGERVTAAKLERMGVLDKVVAPDELGGEAFKLASALAQKAPLALRSIKWATMEAERTLDFHGNYRVVETRESRVLSNTEDRQEAVRAFVDKRPPVFKGK